jgi:hypothetical protein
LRLLFLSVLFRGLLVDLQHLLFLPTALKMGKKQTSTVWKYFETKGDESVCRVANCTNLKVGSQKAANVKSHLNVYHKEVYAEVQAEDASKVSENAIKSSNAKFQTGSASNDNFRVNFGLLRSLFLIL